MLERVDEIMLMLKQGKITEKKALSMLTSDYNYSIQDEDRKDRAIAERVAESLSFKNMTPEEYIIEKEERKEIQNLLQEAFVKLSGSKSYRAIIILYVIEGLPLAQCARIMGVKRQVIQNYLKKIQKKFKNWGDKYPKYSIIYRGAIETLLETRNSGKQFPSSLPTFPFERVLRIEHGKWYTTKFYGTKRKIYRTVGKCGLPEYLDATFGENDIKCPNLCRRVNCTKR